MKKSLEFIPVKKMHSNSVLKGWPADKAKGIEKVHDLHITRLIDNSVVSIWKCKSIIERVKFLFTGEITFMVQSKTHPPISILIHDQIRMDGQS